MINIYIYFMISKHIYFKLTLCFQSHLGPPTSPYLSYRYKIRLTETWEYRIPKPPNSLNPPPQPLLHNHAMLHLNNIEAFFLFRNVECNSFVGNVQLEDYRSLAFPTSTHLDGIIHLNPFIHMHIDSDVLIIYKS